MYRVTSEDNPIPVQGNMHQPAPCRTLEPDQTGLFQFFTPVGAQATVCRTGHRVFFYPDRGSKEAGNKIILGKIGDRCDNNPACQNELLEHSYQDPDCIHHPQKEVRQGYQAGSAP